MAGRGLPGGAFRLGPAAGLQLALHFPARPDGEGRASDFLGDELKLATLRHHSRLLFKGPVLGVLSGRHRVLQTDPPAGGGGLEPDGLPFLCGVIFFTVTPAFLRRAFNLPPWLTWLA